MKKTILTLAMTTSLFASQTFAQGLNQSIVLNLKNSAGKILAVNAVLIDQSAQGAFMSNLTIAQNGKTLSLSETSSTMIAKLACESLGYSTSLAETGAAITIKPMVAGVVDVTSDLQLVNARPVVVKILNSKGVNRRVVVGAIRTVSCN